jgi:hypothetical protein
VNYSCIEDDAFVESKALISDAKSIDEAIDATIWVLAHDPYVYDLARPLVFKDGKPIRLAKTKRLRNIQPLLIWFYIEGPIVHLLDVAAIDDGN